MLVDITKLKDSIGNFTNPLDYFVFVLPVNVVSCIEPIVLARQTPQEITETQSWQSMRTEQWDHLTVSLASSDIAENISTVSTVSTDVWPS